MCKVLHLTIFSTYSTWSLCSLGKKYVSKNFFLSFRCCSACWCSLNNMDWIDLFLIELPPVNLQGNLFNQTIQLIQAQHAIKFLGQFVAFVLSGLQFLSKFLFSLKFWALLLIHDLPMLFYHSTISLNIADFTVHFWASLYNILKLFPLLHFLILEL